MDRPYRTRCRWPGGQPGGPASSIKKEKPKNAHVILGRGLLETLAGRGEQMIYEEGQAHRYQDHMWEDLNMDKDVGRGAGRLRHPRTHVA
jgi:hypothetical protein